MLPRVLQPVFRPRRRGVSLIEVVMVTVIIGILVSLAVPTFHRAIEQSRADVAAANLLALTRPDLAGGVYTVATGQSASLNDILAALDRAAVDVAGEPVRRRFAPAREGDILHSAGSSTRLQSCGWRPQVSLEQGIRELLTADS